MACNAVPGEPMAKERTEKVRKAVIAFETAVKFNFFKKAYKRGERINTKYDIGHCASFAC